ncbi:hypothetical protein J4426_03015 [Candidatus Woesearchaeota archaeon]|nr:hypothetical protein [Candidatus Woesearchaeota archaeon]
MEEKTNKVKSDKGFELEKLKAKMEYWKTNHYNFNWFSIVLIGVLLTLAQSLENMIEEERLLWFIGLVFILVGFGIYYSIKNNNFNKKINAIKKEIDRL